jgi:hypothetical protein
LKKQPFVDNPDALMGSFKKSGQSALAKSKRPTNEKTFGEKHK